jgi:Beta-galactosidase
MEIVNSRPRRLPFLLLLTITLALPHLVSAQVPRGVFALLPAGGGLGKRSTVFSNPSVDGISVRQHWCDLQPSERVFDFSYLDAVIAKAAANGKKVLLRIGTSGGSCSTGGNTPDWVFDAIKAEPLPTSQKFFTWDDRGAPRTIAVFWDPVYLAKKKAMITALGAHFANNPTVRIVTASFANARSEDWAVPDSSACIATWLADGYTTAKMLDAGKQIIDTTMTAFPNQYVAIAVGSTSPQLDPDNSYVARNAVLAANTTWPGRLIVQRESLSMLTPSAPGTGSMWELVWNNLPNSAAQELDPCYGDPTYRDNGGVPIDPSKELVQIVNKGLGYHLKYIEIYRDDIVNLPAATQYANVALTAP